MKSTSNEENSQPQEALGYPTSSPQSLLGMQMGCKGCAAGGPEGTHFPAFCHTMNTNSPRVTHKARKERTGLKPATLRLNASTHLPPPWPSPWQTPSSAQCRIPSGELAMGVWQEPA